MRSRSDVNLKKALEARFPNEDVEGVAELLSAALEKGCVTYQQIDMSEDAKEDVVLFAYTHRLLLPSKSRKTMAWEDRPLTLDADECYRMPGVVAEVVRRAQETGRWDPEPAIRRYFSEHCDERASDKLKLFRKLKDKARNGKVTPYIFRQCVVELGLRVDINQAIAEFKSANLISPSLHQAVSSGRIEYEVNPSL